MIPWGIILGYHGCEAGLAREVVLRETTLRPSANGYDWLGQGIYFWAHDPVRAQEWPEKQRKQGHELAIIGAAIDLGRCLNLAERHAVEQVKEAYLWLKEGFEILGRLGDIPVNRGVRRTLDNRVFGALHDLKNGRGLAPAIRCGDRLLWRRPADLRWGETAVAGSSPDLCKKLGVNAGFFTG
jgi:hypothetical protein